MSSAAVAQAEIFAAICADDFSVDGQPPVVLKDRTTCFSEHNNLIWDD